VFVTVLPASTLLRQLRSNLRRSLGQREVAVYGVCLLLLVALLVFAASSPISVVLVLAMLWALGHEQRTSDQHSQNSLARRLEADGNADDEARERLLLWAHANSNDEEVPWKSDC
jgi:hypothetical protein